MKLSAAQVKYAQNRLAEIVAAKIKAKQVAVPPKPVLNLSLKDMYTKVANGSALLRPLKELVPLEKEASRRYEAECPSKAFQLLFVFPEHEAELDKWNAAFKTAKAANEKHAATIERKAAKVMDRIMLSGDAEGALKLLEAFAAEE